MDKSNGSGKNSAVAENTESTRKRGGLFSYLIGVRQELAKVVWPTRQELTKNTIVVFGVCILFALGFWLIDTGFLAALREILGISLS